MTDWKTFAFLAALALFTVAYMAAVELKEYGCKRFVQDMVAKIADRIPESLLQSTYLL